MLSYCDTFLFIISYVPYAAFSPCQEKYVGDFSLSIKSYFGIVAKDTVRAVRVIKNCDVLAVYNSFLAKYFRFAKGSEAKTS